MRENSKISPSAAEQGAEKVSLIVILSEAKNLSFRETWAIREILRAKPALRMTTESFFRSL